MTCVNYMAVVKKFFIINNGVSYTSHMHRFQLEVLKRHLLELKSTNCGLRLLVPFLEPLFQERKNHPPPTKKKKPSEETQHDSIIVNCHQNDIKNSININICILCIYSSLDILCYIVNVRKLITFSFNIFEMGGFQCIKNVLPKRSNKKRN